MTDRAPAVGREEIAAALGDYPGEGHRSIAARLGTSPSSVDRACRMARQDSGAECVHGRQAKPSADASAPTRADGPQEPGAKVIQMPQRTDPEPAEDAPAASTAALEVRPGVQNRTPAPRDEPSPAVAADQPAPAASGTDANGRDLLAWAPPPVDPALLWRCEFCGWKQMRDVTSCEHCGWPAGRETPR